MEEARQQESVMTFLPVARIGKSPRTSLIRFKVPNHVWNEHFQLSINQDAVRVGRGLVGNILFLVEDVVAGRSSVE